MKTTKKQTFLSSLLIVVALQFSTMSFAQSPYTRFNSSTTISLARTYSIEFHSNSQKYFRLVFEGDSLKGEGTLSLDSAAAQFMKYVIEIYSKKVNQLKEENDTLRQRAISIKKEDDK